MADPTHGAFRQVIIVALPGLGAGAQPDAVEYHDRGASTLEHVARYVGGVQLPNLGWLGVGNLTPSDAIASADPPAASVARAARATGGVDVAGALEELVGDAVRALGEGGIDVHAIGQAAHAFVGVDGVTTHEVEARQELVEAVTAIMRKHPEGVIVASPDVHRGLVGAGPVGVARALTRFDASLTALLDQLDSHVLLIIVGLGGNDATIVHRGALTREYVPVLAYAASVPSGVDLGTRLTLADVGATAADVFGAAADSPGTSFLGELFA
ncbi:MAG: hypothetical protein EP329_11440 [Deltaproteobacteria bacterium]|nr:MAG: hypothetical protein EP329_11440 [Deltaproteobacteria bacterium]